MCQCMPRQGIKPRCAVHGTIWVVAASAFLSTCCSAHASASVGGLCWYKPRRYSFSGLMVQDRETVMIPRKPDRRSRSPTATLKIVKVLEFSSQTLRSGVVVLASDGLPNTARLFIRGAPAVIRDIVQPSSLPDNFNEVHLFCICLHVTV